jgi:hypothetical protein
VICSHCGKNHIDGECPDMSRGSRNQSQLIQAAYGGGGRGAGRGAARGQQNGGRGRPRNPNFFRGARRGNGGRGGPFFPAPWHFMGGFDMPPLPPGPAGGAALPALPAPDNRHGAPAGRR